MYKKFLVLSTVLFFYVLSYAQEQITITTYYPSPYGIYNELTVTNNLRLETDPTNPASDGPQIEWRTSNVAADRHWNIDQYGTRLRFFTEENFDNVNGAERMTILEAGNVGIGTTTPTNKLDVSEGDGVVARISVGQRTGAEGNKMLNPLGTGTTNSGRSYFGSGWDDNFFISTFDSEPNPNFSIGIGDGAGGLRHQPVNWNGMLILNGSEKTWMPSAGVPVSSTARADMVIDVNGDVGIGTTNPAGRAELHRFEVNMGGNIGGIGGGDNDYFSVNKDRNIGLELRSGTTGGTPYIDFSNDATSDHDMRIILNGDDNLEISGGNVGIGTGAPRAKLHVVGNGEGIWLDRTSGPVPLRFLQNNTRIWTIEGSDESPYPLLFRAVADDFIDFIEPLTLYRNGDVGIGPNNSIQNTLDDDWTPTLRHGEDTLMDPFHYISFQWGDDSSFRIMVDGNYVLRLPTAGFPTSLKTFVINHPLDNSKYLVHATLEGPEAGVYYRGTTKLKEGMAEIKLPDYFETLTALEGRSVQLTAIDGFDRLSVKKVNGQQIYLAKFTVYSDNPHSEQEFNWEVKAARKDVPSLIVEPDKNKITVLGEGPYTYYKERIE